MTAVVEDYLAELQRIRGTGAATEERSYYPPLRDLLNAVGRTLRPKVFSVIELGQQGAGHPDIGLFAANQVSKGQPRQGQLPASGVVEVKGAGDDAWLTADSAQVSRYWQRYRLVLVTTPATSCCWARTRRATRPGTVSEAQLPGNCILVPQELAGNIQVRPRE